VKRELFPAFLYVYVDDADRAYRRALAAGKQRAWKSLSTPPTAIGAPWFVDNFGNVFQIAHRNT